ncbi:MAG: diguanylate cyclase, partial [Synergistaceae bacterium]|nr:diguanylate cyclase [Synergistaceae bacterium]
MEKILIIDDNPMDVRILKDILKDRYEVISSLESSEGINKVRLHRPAVILLDSFMPKINKKEVLFTIKNTNDFKDIPVILTSATTQVDQDTEEKWLSMGAVDYFIKPFSPGIVKTRVGTHVNLYLLKEAVDRLELIDSLTLLPNRRSYDEKIDTEWARAVREKTPLSIAFIDIDHFTAYNNQYGNSKGDDALRLVASEIRYVMSRKTDFVARFSPEKIVIVLPNTAKKGASIVYERIKKAIQNLKIPHAHSPSSDIISVSIGGVTIVPSYGDSLHDFTESADKRLFEAKAYGRNMIASDE